MSTRATYLVRVRQVFGSFSQCFYKHHDGYVSGAQHFFREAMALEFSQSNGVNFAKRLINIDGVEFTDCHEDHGDTEFRYTITDRGNEIFIAAEKRVIEEESGIVSWRTFFDGDMDTFIGFKPETSE